MIDSSVVVRRAAGSEWHVVERLAQLYLHDLSESRGYTPNPDGTYGFQVLDLFRVENGRQAWLIEDGATLGGFALTRPWERGGTSMYAFFVVRSLRRTGVGRDAARQLLRRIPGAWGIAFQDHNPGARPFWERVATEVVGDRWRLETALEAGMATAEGSPDIWLRLDTSNLAGQHS